MKNYPLMFAPTQIGSMLLKNRLVMPPMIRNYADVDGMVTKRYVDHIKSIATGGVGMIILEASYISPEGKGFVNELGIHTDTVIPGLSKLAKAAHAHGAKIGVQIFHAGRQTSSIVTGLHSVASSPIPDPTLHEVPLELTVEDIQRLVQAFGKAAERAKLAGMDFVEVHGAHGYLISQFLSHLSNVRRDEYGGSPKKRMRFIIEVYEAMRKAVGPDFPIIFRLSGEEMLEGGLRIEDTVEIAKQLEEIGVDALHISVGNYASYVRGFMIPPMSIEDGPIVHMAAAVKKAVNIPVIAVGKLRTPEIVEQTLSEGSADLVAIGRTLLADPEWPNKVKEGREEEINKCIACNQGCISRVFAQKDVWCTVNPQTGREAMFAKKLGKAKKVLIVGGGPAGLSAAKVAAERGHYVTLYEATSKLGGAANIAALLPYHEDFASLSKMLVDNVKRLGVEIHLKKKFSKELALQSDFDVAIVAVGSSPSKPNMPGIDQANVLFARDVVEARMKPKGKVVIVGGGCVGAEVAELIAHEGSSVTIIESSSAIATEVPSDQRFLLLERLSSMQVDMITDATVTKIGSKSVSIESVKGHKMLEADTVIISLGSYSNDGITDELKRLVPKVIVIGDAKKPRSVTEAVAEGALAALGI